MLSDPKDQFGTVQVPMEGVTLTTEYPLGNISFTLTPIALLGPLFVAVIVNVTFVPIVGLELFTVFKTPKSAQPTTFIATASEHPCEV